MIFPLLKDRFNKNHWGTDRLTFRKVSIEFQFEGNWKFIDTEMIF